MNVALIDSTNLMPAMLSKMLENTGINITCFSNSKTALEKLRYEHFDCICASLNIADGSDGIFIARELRQGSCNTNTPILLLTNEHLDKLYVKALAAGITEVFFREELDSLVNFLIRLADKQKPLSGKVLFIEDSKSQQAYVKGIFNQKGLQVTAYSTAEQAWEDYQQNDYDLVVTDIVLDGKSTGMALTNWIRRLDDDKGEVPILAMTGYDDVARRVELFNLGISDYVIKPIIEDELIARVRQLIKGHHYYLDAKLQKEKAEQASSAKSAFIAHLNHEFRIPLNSILGFTELLMTDTAFPLAAEQNQNLQQIESAGQILNRLIQDLTNLSKIEAGILDLNPEYIYVNTAIEYSISHVSSFAEKNNVTFLPFSAPDDLSIYADPARLNQVLVNLFSNAIKYNSEKGTIQTVFKKCDDGYIRIGIIDTGIGIEQKEIASLFMPFSRPHSDTSIEGTGLGLVICKQLITQMNGRIGCKSKKGRGSTFWIELPSNPAN
jgi:signal transduction histidine kinase